MGHKSREKAQKRARQIAQVQRQRDLGDIWQFKTKSEPPDSFYYNSYDLPIIQVFEAQKMHGSIGIHDVIPREYADFAFDANIDITPPFEAFWMWWDDKENGRHWVNLYEKEKNRRWWGCYYSPYGTDESIFLYIGMVNGKTVFNGWEVSGFADQSEALYFGFTVLEALAYLNTPTIELVDILPNPRLSEIHEREFGAPLTTYKALKVNTSHKQYQGENKDSGLVDFDPRRMHIVRGHWAEYGTNGRKLLFGKYARKIWIPAHVRGNEELGTVVKDYEIVSPD